MKYDDADSLELERNTKKKPARMKPDPDSEVIGWMAATEEQSQRCWIPIGCERRPGRAPITRGFYRKYKQLLPQLWTDHNKANQVVEVQRLIEESRVANRKGKGLKQLSDAARNLVGEIPSSIPKDGFADIECMTYSTCLQVEQIESILMAHLERVGLLDWYKLAAQ